MSILVHVCCGPCLVYPAQVLNSDSVEFTGFFYNPNIHPYKEFRRRLDSAKLLSEQENIELIIDRNYGLQEFLRNVVFNEKGRCRYCYRTRLEQTAKVAKERGFRGFSSTLLYSRYQNHRDIVSLAEDIGTGSVPFYYHDFRVGWQSGIDESRSLGLYRQSYCGCIYSEQERYDKSLKKRLKKEKQQNV
jgi:predicted adenine nucleotide alpha hydrolase (AANH) superfamily ATPase